MKLATLRRRPVELPGVSGVARLDRRTTRLAGRLHPGDIAIIDHVDLDRVAAEALVAARPAAVVNAQPSISGRYPNLGPEVIVNAGIPLLDEVGSEVFAAVKDGTRVRICGDAVYVGEGAVVTGTAQDPAGVAARMEEARTGLSAQLEAFAMNTSEYLARERDLLLDGLGIPEVRTRIAGRHVVVVVRGYEYRQDLKRLKHYIREFKPVLIGVDGGADALLDAGLRPHLIIGDMDAVSDAALATGAEVVVHAYPDGRAPGLPRVQDLGIDARHLPQRGHQRGPGAAARRPVRGRAHRRGGEPRDVAGVPRQGPGGDGLDVPHPAAGRRPARRRRRRGPALPQPDLRRRAAAARHRRAGRRGRRARRVRHRPQLSHRPRPARRRRRPLGTGPVLVISFRYHIVSLVAVFLALALGIVIGTTALNGPITSDLRHQVNDLKAERSQLAGQVKSLQGQVDTAGQFATTFGPQVVAGALKGTSLLVVGLPGTSTGMQDGIAGQLSAAGAQITGRVQLAASFTDPTQANQISDLATGPTHPLGITLPTTSDARQLGAALLAFVLTGHGEATDLKTVLTSFAGLHMITSDPAGVEPAKTVVVVGNGSQPQDGYGGQAELDLVSALTSSGGTVVVAGDTGSAQGNGIVAMVRDGTARSAVSTVDNADSPFGQVSTALAVAAAGNDQVGQYGTARGAQALFPTKTK